MSVIRAKAIHNNSAQAFVDLAREEMGAGSIRWRDMDLRYLFSPLVLDPHGSACDPGGAGRIDSGCTEAGGC